MRSVVEPQRETGVSCYQFKASPYSSHTILLNALRAPGDGRRVLDIGCANGYLGRILAARGYEVVGIESPGRAGQGFPETVQLVEADLDAGLPRVPGRFDFVLCADILEHLREPLQLLLASREILKPDGRLIASLPNSGHVYFRFNVLMGKFPQHDEGLFDRTHLHFYMWRGWVELFGAAGLSIESVQATGVPVGLAFPKWDQTILVRALERLSFDLARLWKTLLAYQFIVSARRENSQ